MVASGSHAYLLNNGLSVLDTSTASHPVAVGQMPLTNCCYGNLSVSGRYVYATSDGGITICDVANPASPVQAGQIPPEFGPAGFAVSGNYGYMAVGGWHGLPVWDVSDPANPSRVGTAAGGTFYAFDVAISGQYAYVTAFTNTLQIYDISNPTNPVNLHVFTGGTPPSELNVAISGNYAYVYQGSLFTVVDISNPTNASIVFDNPNGDYTDSFITKMAISGNYAYFPTSAGLSIWSLGIAAPRLSISTTATNTAALTWPTPAGAFSVQQNPSLNPSNWVSLTNVPVVVAAQNQVMIPAPMETMFFRLVSQ
jgi:hypothetical protein